MKFSNIPQAHLFEVLKGLHLPFSVFEHSPCRTSQESRAARSSAGFPDAEGAKALICRIEQSGDFVLIVLPGTMKLDSSAVRKRIGKFRFATAEEVTMVSDGLAIGTIPPFPAPVLPGVHCLLVDERLFEFEHVGFNAAELTRSVVMTAKDYAKFVPASNRGLFSCA